MKVGLPGTAEAAGAAGAPCSRAGSSLQCCQRIPPAGNGRAVIPGCQSPAPHGEHSAGELWSRHRTLSGAFTNPARTDSVQWLPGKAPASGRQGEPFPSVPGAQPRLHRTWSEHFRPQRLTESSSHLPARTESAGAQPEQLQIPSSSLPHLPSHRCSAWASSWRFIPAKHHFPPPWHSHNTPHCWWIWGPDDHLAKILCSLFLFKLKNVRFQIFFLMEDERSSGLCQLAAWNPQQRAAHASDWYQHLHFPNQDNYSYTTTL